MSSLVIREMRIDDLEKSLSLIRKVIIVSNSKDYTETIIKNLLSHYSLSNFKNVYHKRKYYIALIESRVVGTVACEDNSVYSLFVDPDYQNKGIGKSLLKRVEEHILKNGYSKSKLSASLTALSFYKSNGYTEIKRVKNNELGDVILMEKKLN